MKACKWLVAFFFIAAVTAPAFAQTDQGRISGTVRDSSSAFVAGAAVSVKNERTGEERKGTSNNEGFFVIALAQAVDLHDQGRESRLRRHRVHGHVRGRRPGTGARLRVQAGRRAGIGHRRRRPRRCSTSARRASAPTSASARCRACRSTAGRCRSCCCRRPARRTRATARGRTSASRAGPTSRTSSSTTASRAPRSSTPRRAT